MMNPSPRRRRQRRTPPALLAFVISVGLHGAAFVVLLVLAAVGWLFSGPGAQTKAVQAVGIRTLSADEWAQNRGAGEQERPESKKRAELAEVKPKDKPKEPEKLPEGQVVDVAPGNGEEDPDANKLAETSNKTAKETKSREQTAFYRNAMPKRTSTTPEQGAAGAADRAEKSGNDGLGEDDRPLREAQDKRLAVEVPDIQKRDEVKLQRDATEGAGPMVANRTESAQVHGNSNRLKLQDGSPSAAEDGSQGKAGKTGAMNLTPSLSVLDSVAGAAPNDHLDEVEEGDGTFLNTREWKYASFFNRVKQSIGMNWNPGRELRQRDPSGSTYGQRDRHTVLQVTLDERGRVTDVFVAKSCGLDFLDLEATRAFERAQPFPNPPSGMLTREGKVNFSFGFFVDMGGRGGALQMFRQN